MDTNQQIPSQNLPPQSDQPSVQPATPPGAPTKKKFWSRKMLTIIGGSSLLGVIILIIVFALASSQRDQADKPTDTSPTSTPSIEQITTTPAAQDTQNPSQIMLYGVWTGQTTVIKAVDLGSSTSFLVATLPLEIKKVSVLSAQNVLFIDQIDTRDHGKRITAYDLKEKLANFSIPAANGYQIDDYVLSPDKKYLAIWEVQFAPNSQILQRGKSRVYAVDLSRPTVKNLLYDEQSTATSPIHYPRAILNDGTVFADKFMPNDPKGGAGWAYGMSVVDFDGTNKREVEAMKPGTYGTQPTLSPDGKYLVFAGYDGTHGDGQAVSNGFRQALLTPNTVDLLNTQSLKRFKLPNLSNSNIYSAVDWEVQTGNIIITTLSKETEQTGVYSYNLATQSPKQIKIPSQKDAVYGYISRLNESKALIGAQDGNPSNMGNLGENYAYPFIQVALLDIPTQKVSFISLQDAFAQYITLLPSNYFQTVLGVKTIAQAVPLPTFTDLSSTQSEDELQLNTFFLKSDLSSQRLKQQSTPVATGESPTCEQLAEIQCQATGMTTGTQAYEDCVKTNKNSNKATLKQEGKCQDSPLYLYGEPGKRVQVKIQTPIYNAVPASSGEYSITLGKLGDMHINDKTYPRVAYDYQSNARRITAPTRGAVVTKSGIEKVLRAYAKKLGLNTLETNDLVAAGKTKITSPYAFISFYNQTQSEYILPITFSPKPDNYLNVVFYFKLYNEKPSFTPIAPSFPDPIKRSGFTAVEVSEMVE